MSGLRESRWLLPSALLLLVLIRLLPVLSIEVVPASDMAWYYQRAVGIVQTGQYAEGGRPTAYWPVGYPGFMAGIFAIFGTSVQVAQLANVALSLLVAVLLYQWCIRQFASRWVGLCAVCLLAVYPNQVGYSLGLYSEPLFTALLLSICLLVRPDASAMRLLAAGVLAGLTTLVKTQMLLLVPPLVILLSLRAWRWRDLTDGLLRALLVCLVMLATIAPWSWRNLVVMGAFIPVSSNGGMSLLAGNNPAMTTSLFTDYDDSSDLVKQVGFSASDQVAADRRARAAAWQWIRENPATFIGLMPKKLFRFWLPDGESEWALHMGYAGYEAHRTPIRALRFLNQAYYFLLLGAMLLGLRRWVDWRRPETLVLPLLCVYFSAISMVFSGQSRYHAPLMPFVIACAAWALTRLRPLR